MQINKGLRIISLAGLVLSGLVIVYLKFFSPAAARSVWVENFVRHYSSNLIPRKLTNEQCTKILSAARAMVGSRVRYDADYVPIGYPGGDVPPDTGVCADVVVRSYREIGIDLQQTVHEELEKDFGSSPQIWKLKAPDTNIDHRRVPNLMWYFTRKWSKRPLSPEPQDYKPCDVIAWDLGNGVTHIGIVTETKNPNQDVPSVIHHIHGSPSEEAVLNRWKIIGHFAY